MDGEWRLVSDNPALGVRHYELDLGNGMAVQRTEHYAIPRIVEENRMAYNDSDGVPWGDGKIVARIPLSVLFGELAEPLRQKDDKFLKRYLNDPENRGYRTFKGRV